jgi:hypothetical protein
MLLITYDQQSVLWHTARTPISSSAQLVFRVRVRGEDLCWFANFRPDCLPLVRFVFFDGVEESLTLFEHQQPNAMRAAKRTSSSANSA